MLTPSLDPLFIAYNIGADGEILRTIYIVRKYFTQQTASNPVFGSFPVKNYSKERFKEWLRVNFCRRAAGTPATDIDFRKVFCPEIHRKQGAQRWRTKITHK